MKIRKLQILINQHKNAMNCLVMMHGVFPRFRFSLTDMSCRFELKFRTKQYGPYHILVQIANQRLQTVLDHG